MDQQEGDIILTAFGDRVKELCDKKKITLTDLSHLIETDYSWLMKIVKGLVDVRLTTICKIARAIGTTPSDLLKYIK